MARFALFLLGTFCLATGGLAQAQDSYFPGHSLLFIDAIAHSNTIFSGEVLKIEDVGTNEAGNEIFVAKIKVPYGPHSRNAVSLTRPGVIRGVLTIPDSGVPVRLWVTPEEHAPEVGNSYIFFANGDTKHGNTECAVTKISTASQDDISDIRRLIKLMQRR